MGVRDIPMPERKPFEFFIECSRENMIDVTKLRYIRNGRQASDDVLGWTVNGNWCDGGMAYITEYELICKIDAPLGYHAALLRNDKCMFVGVGKCRGYAIVPVSTPEGCAPRRPPASAFSLFANPSQEWQDVAQQAGLHFVDETQWAHQYMSEIDASECFIENDELLHCRYDYYTCGKRIVSRTHLAPTKIAEGIYHRVDVIITPPFVHLYGCRLTNNGKLFVDIHRDLAAWIGELKAPPTQLVAWRAMMPAPTGLGLTCANLPVELITLIDAYVPRPGLVTDKSVTVYETEEEATTISRYFHIPLGVPIQNGGGVLCMENYYVLDPWSMSYFPLPVGTRTAEPNGFYILDGDLGYVRDGIDFTLLTAVDAGFKLKKIARRGFEIVTCDHPMWNAHTVCVKGNTFADCDSAFYDVL